MKLAHKPSVPDEISLENSPLFEARLAYLTDEGRAELKPLLAKGHLALLTHLREMTNRALHAEQELVRLGMPEDGARETVIASLLAPPKPPDHPDPPPLTHQEQAALKRFEASLPHVRPTYQTEITA